MRSIIGLTATLFSLVASAQAQDIAGDQGRIAGIVVSADGAPIDLVQVSVVDSRLGVVTDSAGRFELGPLAAGQYVPWSSRPSVRGTRAPTSSPSTIVCLRSGRATSPL